jgi:hypothetical protein
MKRRPVLIVAAIVGGAFVVGCMVCVAIGALSGGSTTPTPATAAIAEAGEGVAVAPSRTPMPSKTPLPTNTPRPANTPTPVPIGMSRDAPAPLGDVVLADDKIELTVIGVKRGQPAWADIHSYNMFNSEPKSGHEYVLVTIRARFTGGSSETKSVSEFYFRCVGERGAIYTSSFVIMDQSMDMELFGGGVGEGRVAFEVPEGEGELVVIYSGTGTKARYLSLE